MGPIPEQQKTAGASQQTRRSGLRLPFTRALTTQWIYYQSRENLSNSWNLPFQVELEAHPRAPWRGGRWRSARPSRPCGTSLALHPHGGPDRTLQPPIADHRSGVPEGPRRAIRLIKRPACFADDHRSSGHIPGL